jgi:hypothetical protein
MSLELIRARQKELADAAQAEKQQRAWLQAQAEALFASTGIPETWAQIKDIKIQHWRWHNWRNADVLEAPLGDHAKLANDVALYLSTPKGGISIGWDVQITDRGAIILRIIGEEARGAPGAGGGGIPATAENVKKHFINYMADILPPAEKTQ